MKMYSVSASELRNASMINNISTSFFSAGAALLSLVIGVWLEVGGDIADPMPNATKTACWLLGIGGAVCMVTGWVLRKCQKSDFDKILAESRDKD